MDWVLPAKADRNGLISVQPKSAGHPLSLRKGTSDLPTFYDVFHAGQYNIDFPKEAKNIIDCGANIGLGTVFFKNRYPAATVVAIEPESSNYELLKKNVSPYANVHCIQSGIWNRDTHLEITNIDTAAKWAFMTEERDAPSPATIPAISIDTICQQFGMDTIDILKVDIEGSEKELFEKNYGNWLPKVKILIIELHDHMRAGTAQSVLSAVSTREFSMYMQGENLVFYFH